MILQSPMQNGFQPLHNSQVLDYLLGRGWVDPALAVDGGLQVVEGERRHRHFRIEHKNGGKGLFLKQIKSWNPVTQVCLQREATCCRLAAADPAFEALKGWIPALRGYDPGLHVLGMELFQGAPNLTQFHGRTGKLAEGPARLLGTVLGRQHRDIRLQVGDRLGALFPGRLPWILDLQSSPAQRSHRQGAGALYVANTLRHDPGLRQAFSQLAWSYQPSCLIHGDLKWDNVLVLESTERGQDEQSVRFVDWELADIGDPLWDVAGVIQSYWASWLFSRPLGSATPPNHMESQADFPLGSVQRALQAFWTAYDDARDFDEETGRRELVQALRFAAARLVQTAFETGVTHGRAVPQLPYLMQLSQSILLDTEQAVTDLVGMKS